MRSVLFAAAAACLVPSLAHAQKQFEGAVTMEMHNEETGKVTPITYYVKNGKMRADFETERGTMSMILDPAAEKSIMLMPQMKMFMENDLSKAMDKADEKQSDAKVTRTGKTETVAGHKCEIVTVTSKDGDEADICAASDLGTFMMMRRPGSPPPAWARGMENMFPLKVTPKGKPTTLVVTKIDPKTVDPSLFQVPADYKPMNMGMMRHP
jgi:hypothetical protein